MRAIISMLLVFSLLFFGAVFLKKRNGNFSSNLSPNDDVGSDMDSSVDTDTDSSVDTDTDSKEIITFIQFKGGTKVTGSKLFFVQPGASFEKFFPGGNSRLSLEKGFVKYSYSGETFYLYDIERDCEVLSEDIFTHSSNYEFRRAMTISLGNEYDIDVLVGYTWQDYFDSCLFAFGSIASTENVGFCMKGSALENLIVDASGAFVDYEDEITDQAYSIKNYTFRIDRDLYCCFNSGMTWRDFVNSSLNDVGLFIEGEDVLITLSGNEASTGIDYALRYGETDQYVDPDEKIREEAYEALRISFPEVPLN